MKPSTPKGTRDFLPSQVRRREYIFETIRRAFRVYGYQPIETPVMEDLSTLTGKYGDEGDKLLFKVLNNGDYLADADEKALAARDSDALVASISKRGLRYDLTVPFARYVVMHQNDLTFPFKRYAIMPVWRADRPQRGRYQEFYQCDADVVGSDSLVYEAELIQLFDRVYAELGLQTVIHVNNRKVLAGLAQLAGQEDKMIDLTVAIDKLDKIGADGVRRELAGRGFPEPAIEATMKALEIEDIAELKTLLADSEIGQQGVAELETVFDLLATSELKNKVRFDVSLARGLNYYTGCILEVKVDTDAHPGIKMGSIGGGGRYADLTGVFGMNDMPGVGISFGAERIYDVLEELDAFPESADAELQVLLIAFDAPTHRYAFDLLTRLRRADIAADLYPEPAKLKKQMKYADRRGVPYTVLIGSREMESGQMQLKNMRTGEQSDRTPEELIAYFTNG
jgi:histidyl-tRNA synthetase